MSPVSGAPAMPGRVVATRRTPDSAGSAITRSKERAALAPPGRRRTDRSASFGPEINNSQASLMAAPSRRTQGFALPIGGRGERGVLCRLKYATSTRTLHNGRILHGAVVRPLIGISERTDRASTRPFAAYRRANVCAWE